MRPMRMQEMVQRQRSVLLREWTWLAICIYLFVTSAMPGCIMDVIREKNIPYRLNYATRKVWLIFNIRKTSGMFGNVRRCSEKFENFRKISESSTSMISSFRCYFIINVWQCIDISANFRNCSTMFRNYFQCSKIFWNFLKILTMLGNFENVRKFSPIFGYVRSVFFGNVRTHCSIYRHRFVTWANIIILE